MHFEYGKKHFTAPGGNGQFSRYFQVKMGNFHGALYKWTHFTTPGYFLAK